MAPRKGPRARANAQEPEVPAATTLDGIMGAVGQVTNLLAQTIALNNQQLERANQAQNQQPAPAARSVMDDFRKENPPVFVGSTDVDVVINWKNNMEKKFNLLGCTDDERLRFSVYKLEGDAEQWWKTTEAILLRDQPVTWEVFQREFDKKYYTDQMRDEKEAEFNRLVQGNLSVGEYEAKFTSLSKFAAHIVVDDGRKARKFVMGLNENIRSLMRLERYEDYSRAVTHALNVEVTEVKRPQEQNQNFKRVQPPLDGNQGRNEDGNAEAPKRQRWNDRGIGQGQFEYQQRDYLEKPECPQCKKKHFGVCRSGKCYNCGQAGHTFRQCAEPRQNREVPNHAQGPNQAAE